MKDSIERKPMKLARHQSGMNRLPLTKRATINFHRMEVVMQIGKNGITDTVVKQTLAMLKKNKAIKVRFFASALKDNKKALAQELADRTNTIVAHRVGFVVVLQRKA